jgi:AcrR family transcriptional regulator
VFSSIGMARVRSPEKRSAILQAAVHEIAKVGLGAPTAKIAGRAGVAAGTLFTYFANKEELLNELYLELKGEVYARLNANFPHKGSLERRALHIWSSFFDWAIEFPEKRKVSVQLNVSDVITPETRARTAAQRGTIDETISELGTREEKRVTGSKRKSSNDGADYRVHHILPETVALEQEAVPHAAISDSTNRFSLVNTLGESEFDLACSIE